MQIIMKIAKWTIALSILGSIFILWIVATDDTPNTEGDDTPAGTDDPDRTLIDIEDSLREEIDDSASELQSISFVESEDGYIINVETHNEPAIIISNDSMIQSRFADMLYIIKASDIRISKINFVSQMLLIDQYGNGEYGDVMTMTISQNSIDKMGDDRDIFNADNLVTIADTWWMHDVLWNE